jgi:hypothetical protein
MFCALGTLFGNFEGVGFRYHVLRSRTHFRQYRRRRVPFLNVLRSWTRSRREGCRRVPFSCFALLDPFSAVPTTTGPVLMFCAPGLIFGDTEGVESCFHVLHYRTHFRRFRGRRVSFSGFALPDPFSAVWRRQDPLTCFPLPDPFSAVSTASCPVFMF